MEKRIADKDQEITRTRNEYYRLVEQFKKQVTEKALVVEDLTKKDTQYMREMLNLRQEIINFEKKREKLTSETTKTMKGTIAETRKEQTNELNENKVKVDELRENMLSMEDITKQKVIAESTLI